MTSSDSQPNQSERKAINFIALLLMSVCGIFGTAYALFTHWDFAVKYSGWLLSLLVAPIILHTFYYMFGYIRCPDAWPEFQESFDRAYAMPVAAAYGLMMYAFMGVGYFEVYKIAFSGTLTNTGSVLMVGLATCAVGVILFYLRLKWRFVYGFSEAVAGVIVAGQRFYSEVIVGSATSAGPLLLTILTAGVYLVVRGADNMHQGITKEPFDPVGVKIIGQLRKMGEAESVKKLLDNPWAKLYTDFVEKIDGISKEPAKSVEKGSAQ